MNEKRFLDREEFFGYPVFEFIGYSIIWLSIVAALIIGSMFLLSKKNVRYYYLSSDRGTPTINTDIENCTDGIIKMNGVAMEDVVKYINQLNQGLNKNGRFKDRSIE